MDESQTPHLFKLVKYLRAQPLMTTIFLSERHWDIVFSEFKDHLSSTFGCGILPLMADGNGFEAFWLKGKKVIRAIL